MNRLVGFTLGILQILLIAAAFAVAIHTQWRLNPGPARASLDYGLRAYALAACLLVLGVGLLRLPGGLSHPEREERGARPAKRRLWLGLLVLAFGLVLVGLALRRILEPAVMLREWGMLLSGFALLGFACASLTRRKAEEAPGGQEEKGTEKGPAVLDREETTAAGQGRRPRFSHFWATMLVAHAAVLPAVGLGLVAGRMWYLEKHPGLAFLPWGGGVLLCVFSLGWLDWRRGWRPFRKVNWPAWWEWVVLAAIIIMAAHFRLYRLSEIPEGLWYDEAQFGRESQHILRNHPPYSPIATFSHNPSLSFYVTAVFFHFLGDTVFALRLPIVLWGLLGIFALYFLARLLFGRVAAIAASLMMAAMYWHVVFCRFNMTNLISPTCAVIGLYFFFRGEHTGRLLDYFGSGVFQSLGLHGYQPAAFMILAFAVVAFHRFFMHRGRLRVDYIGKLCLVAVAGFLVFVPLGAYAKKHPQKVSRRMRETALWKQHVRPDGAIDRPGLVEELKNPRSWMRTKLRDTTWKHLLFFNYTGDWIRRHGVPHLPRVDRLTGAFFVLGLVLAWFYARQSRYFLLIVWWFCGLLPGILTLPFEAPQSARTVIGIPGIALLAALPIDLAVRVLRHRWQAVVDAVSRFRIYLRAFGWGVIGLLLGAVAVYVTRENYRLYFDVHQQRPDVWQAYMGRETTVARTIVSLPQDWVFYQQNRMTEPSRFLGAQPPKDRFFVAYRDLPPTEMHRADCVYVLENDRNPLPEQHWVSIFGTGDFKQFMNKFGEPVCFSYHIGAAALESLKGIHAIYRSTEESIRPLELDQPWLDVAPSPDWSGRDSPFQFRWWGMLYAPRTGQFRFRWNPLLDAEVKIDSRQATAEPMRLVCGWHNFEAEGTLSEPVRPRFEWRLPGGAAFIPIERRYLFARPLPEHGLLGFYYPTPAWGGEPVFRRIDPLLDFRWRVFPTSLRPDWSARWIGYLLIEEPGTYSFQLEGPSPVTVRIDGKDVIVTRRRGKQGNITLSPGKFPIDIWYRRGGPTYPQRLELYWRPPGKAVRSLVPYQSFVPAYVPPAEGSPFSVKPPGM